MRASRHLRIRRKQTELAEQRPHAPLPGPIRPCATVGSGAAVTFASRPEAASFCATTRIACAPVHQRGLDKGRRRYELTPMLMSEQPSVMTTSSFLMGGPSIQTGLRLFGLQRKTLPSLSSI